MLVNIRYGLLAAVLAVPALSACQAPAADPAKDEAAINAQIDGFNAAAKAKDATKMVAEDADDIKGYGGGGPDVASKADDLKANQGAVTDPAYALSIKAEHTEVAKSGDIAWQTGSWDATGTNPATKAVEHTTGHWVAGWRKDKDGTWKLAAVSAANAPSAAMAAAAPAPAADAKPAEPAKK